MWKILSPLLLPLAAASNQQVDCQYSLCSEQLTFADCQSISSTCQGFGGVAFCSIGEYEFECANIRLTDGETCSSDASAVSICSEFDYSSLVSCSHVEADCEGATPLTSAPTPSGGNSVTRVDCSYDACSAALTSSDCSSLSTQCATNGGVLSCEPGDVEFECNNIPYTGGGTCSDSSATTQCSSYEYSGYSCTQQEGDCDDASSLTLAPTPSTVTVQKIDCEFDDCTKMLTAEDCQNISNACGSIGGTAFCIPGDIEFECNNIAFTGGGSCSDASATSQCASYPFSGFSCLSKEGDCDSMSSDSSDSEDLSDGEKLAIGLFVPIAVVAIGLLIWYALSKRAASASTPMASKEASNEEPSL